MANTTNIPNYNPYTDVRSLYPNLISEPEAEEVEK